MKASGGTPSFSGWRCPRVARFNGKSHSYCYVIEKKIESFWCYKCVYYRICTQHFYGNYRERSDSPEGMFRSDILNSAWISIYCTHPGTTSRLYDFSQGWKAKITALDTWKRWMARHLSSSLQFAAKVGGLNFFFAWWFVCPQSSKKVHCSTVGTIIRMPASTGYTDGYDGTPSSFIDFFL